MKNIKFQNELGEVRGLEHNSFNPSNLKKEKTLSEEELHNALMGHQTLIAGYQLKVTRGALILGIWMRATG